MIQKPEMEPAEAEKREFLVEVGGVRLLSEDVSCLLREDQWLTDTAILFYLEYLRHYKYGESRDEVEAVSPSVVQHLKLCRSARDAEDMLAPLDLASKTVVLMPLNNADETANYAGSAGSHWSLLVLTPADGRFHHFDSLDMNHSCAKLVSNKVQQHLRFPSPRFLHFKGAPQDNPFDCGLFVLLNAGKALGHFLSGGQGRDFVPAQRGEAAGMREIVLVAAREVEEVEKDEEAAGK